MARFVLIGSTLLLTPACYDESPLPETGTGGASTMTDDSTVGPTGSTASGTNDTPATASTSAGTEMSGPATDDGSGTTSIGPSGSDSGSGYGSGSSGSGSGSSGSGSSGTTSACMPITDDVSAIGTDCLGQPESCPTGYTCQDMPGIVAQAQCEIICTEDCDCPDAYSCVMMSAKGVDWMQCNPD